MSQTQLKNYGPEARVDFIDMVTRGAAVYGITKDKIEPVEVTGDTAVINGTAYPKKVVRQRQQLEELVEQDGFEHTMDAMAYTWFNRFMAIRYMELHGYLDHGFRVLSHPEGNSTPEILQHAERVELHGLDKESVVDLKLDGTKDADLYRMLIVAQCNALQSALPFLFEEIDDATELLLPADLLHSESVIRKMVEAIDEEDWQEVEIIGWLYQFYISEKKDEVIGKVVKSEDIPAATQLFTPNWIVKYMVQNSLGAQWLATYPQSPLKGQMEYYIEPAEQTTEVIAQLAAITPSQLNPEELTLIDPASGSGHILVEAYELFKAIYLERGYRQRDVPQLILEKNLFGLDIDERAAQLTGFALMMKGRADDRQLFERGVKLNVMALVDSARFDAEGLAKGVELSDYGLKPGDLTELKQLFEHATTFGSLIQVPEGLAEKLPALKKSSEVTSQDLFVSEALQRLGQLVQQTELLATQYDAVLANPPYMGSKFHNPVLKKFAKKEFPETKSDLFACFIERGYTLAKDGGHDAMVTMQSWMFLSSFERMRERLFREKTIGTMAHLGARAFGSISGSVVQATAAVLKNHSIKGYKPAFFRLLDGAESEKRSSLSNGENRFDATAQDDFKRIPDSPVAYWVSAKMRQVFQENQSIGQFATLREGIHTGKNEAYVRTWSEVSFDDICFDASENSDVDEAGKNYVPYNKGGKFRRWFGNNEQILAWDSQSRESMAELKGHVRPSQHLYFRSGLEWSLISGSHFGVRSFPSGMLNDVASHYLISKDEPSKWVALGFLASIVNDAVLKILNPTLNFSSGVVSKAPLAEPDRVKAVGTIVGCVGLSKSDWNAYERSWDFQFLPILTASSDSTPTLESSYTDWINQNRDTITEMKRLEEENNRLFIDAYGLQDELTPEVPIEQITLTVNPAYRYGGKLSEEELWTRFRQDTMEELLSYAIGCMMGRYSLDAPGLIYAHSGNEGFDSSKYTTFSADDDGILPITDIDWFDDDIANRVAEFISVAWPAERLEENLAFLADNLGRKNSESARDAIRRYLSKDFFKDHLQTYKKRPIYWLFNSGKQKAFQCLVYLHRYNEGTLARIRTEYLIPLQSKINARLSHLEDDIEAAGSTSQRKKLEKERDTLVKQQAELATFDEKLRHHADQRISLDLDDGVKVNYDKFGDLLAEVKAVTGKKATT